MSELADLFESLPHAAVPVVRAIVEAQTRHCLFPTDQASVDRPTTVVIGVSGGADSTCLLHALAALAPHWNLDLHVAHLDHRLRPESASDAAFVSDLAANLNLPCHLQYLDRATLQLGSGGLEDAARRARYRFLHHVAQSIAQPLQPNVVAVAHQKDDQAETLIMNLLRGSGLSGLSGMPWKARLSAQVFSNTLATDDMDSSYHEVRLVRPLLDVQRTDVLRYLKAFDLGWREDSTNRDTTRYRNRVRHDILPNLRESNENVVDTLARTAQILAGETDRAGQYDRQALDAVIIGPGANDGNESRATLLPPNRIVLDLDQFLHFDIATQRGVLRLASSRLSVDLRELGFAHLESLIWQVRTGHHKGGTHTVLGNLAWTVTAADGRHPARLSLHAPDTPPFVPEGPYLSDAWRNMHPCQSIIYPGTVEVPGGWQLHCRQIARHELPSTWLERGRPWRAFIDSGCADQLVLASPRPGLRFSPLGLCGHRKSLGDFFTDRKVPQCLRRGWPIVLDSADGQIVWVCGQEISHQVRITSVTKQVLWLQWNHAEEDGEVDEMPPYSQFLPKREGRA